MSNYYNGKVSMKPDMNKFDCVSEDGCIFKIPEVYFSEAGEIHEEDAYNWDVSFLTVVKDTSVVKYTTSNFSEMLIEDDYGVPSWIQGRMANMLGVDVCDADAFRENKEFKIEEFDLEKSIKRRYKVILEETSDMNEFDFREVKSIINDENDNDNNL